MHEERLGKLLEDLEIVEERLLEMLVIDGRGRMVERNYFYDSVARFGIELFAVRLANGFDIEFHAKHTHDVAVGEAAERRDDFGLYDIDLSVEERTICFDF